jgi:hypothetical protein
VGIAARFACNPETDDIYALIGIAGSDIDRHVQAARTAPPGQGKFSGDGFHGGNQLAGDVGIKIAAWFCWCCGHVVPHG